VAAFRQKAIKGFGKYSTLLTAANGQEQTITQRATTVLANGQMRPAYIYAGT
jgi:hypothetical protein